MTTQQDVEALVTHRVTRVREVRIIEELEILAPASIDHNPFIWDDWQNLIEESGIQPTVLDTEHINVRTDVISFAPPRR